MPLGNTVGGGSTGAQFIPTWQQPLTNVGGCFFEGGGEKSSIKNTIWCFVKHQ
jgi:hypothetical protein